MPPNHQLTIIEPSEEPPVPPPAAPRTKAEIKAEQEAELQAACKATWAAYRQAYAQRYGVPPVRNEKVSSQMKEFVRRIGRGEAPEVAAWYVQAINEAWVVKACHDVGSLLSRAEAYRTRAERPAIACLSLLAYDRVVSVIAQARPRPLDLTVAGDRWRLRLVIFDAAHELVWPERRQTWAALAKAANMRRGTYCDVHRVATAVLQAALNDGRREFHGRLFAEHQSR